MADDMNSAPFESTVEQTVAVLRGHGRVLALPFVASLIIVGGGLWGIPQLDEPWQLPAVLLAFLGFVALVVVPWLRWWVRTTTITTIRVFTQRGTLRRQYHEVLLSRVIDISVHQSIGQSVAGSGNISLNTGLEQSLVIADVAAVARVRAALAELVHANAHGQRPGFSSTN
jgi:hypothetical protein